jgi:hypothetical protein
MMTDKEAHMYEKDGYEIYLDPAYHHLWAVRKKGVTKFEETLHAPTRAEAENIAITPAEKDAQITALLSASPKWVSVKERLPEFDTPVLCWGRIHGRFVGVYSRIDGTSWGQWSNQKEIGILPPVAWMPLPPAPTEE